MALKFERNLAKILNEKYKDKKPKTAEAPKAEDTSDKTYEFLSGEFGKQIHEKIIEKYQGVEAITKIPFKDSLVKGSNPFYVVAVNDELRSQNLDVRTATQADLEKILKTNALNLRDIYEDTGLVLRSEEEPNEYLAKNLAKQLKARGYKFSKTKPLLIWLKDCELIKDEKSDYGISFKIRDGAEILIAPEFTGENSGKKFSQTNDNGMPIFDDNGERYNWTRENGLSRLYLNRYLNVISSDDGLANSGENGRVVLVRAESANARAAKIGGTA